MIRISRAFIGLQILFLASVSVSITQVHALDAAGISDTEAIHSIGEQIELAFAIKDTSRVAKISSPNAHASLDTELQEFRKAMLPPGAELKVTGMTLSQSATNTAICIYDYEYSQKLGPTPIINRGIMKLDLEKNSQGQWLISKWVTEVTERAEVGFSVLGRGKK